MPKPKPSKPVLLAVSFKQFYFLKGIAEFTFKQILMLKGSLRFTLKQSCALKRIAVVVSLSFVFGLSYLVSWSPAPVYASTANTINFQARLETATGAIVPDGTYNAEFKLYNASSSSGSSQGSCSGDVHCLWFEDYLVTGTPVSVANGYMTVNLGSQTAFPNTIPWGSSLYLGINIGGTGSSPTWDGEMSPRLTLTAVPAAFSLESAAGSLTSTLNFVQPTTSESILLPAESGTTEYVCYQNDATNCGYIANQSTQQTSANFNISGEGQVATLDATGSGSANTLAIGAGATYTGAINIDTSSSVTTGTITVGGTAQTGNIVLGQYNGSSSSTINIGDNAGSSSTQNVNIANSSNGTNTVNVGSTNGSSSTTVDGGTGAGAIALQAASGGIISIGTNATNPLNIGYSVAPTYVGQSHNSGTGVNTVSVTSVTTGDILMLATKGNINNRIVSVSGGGVSAWHMVTYFNGYLHEEIWEGTVTSPGTSTVTATYLGGGCSGSCEMTVQEFSSTLGASTNWTVTAAGQQQNVVAGNISLPSLTASENNGLYWGYGYTNGAGSGGGTGSFTYVVLPSTSNVIAYNTSLTKGTSYAPVANSSSFTSDAVAAIISASSSSVNIDGTTALEGAVTSPLVVAGTNNSTLAFQVQSASGSTAFDVDTVNNIVTSDDTLQVGPGITTATPRFLYLADVTSTSTGNPQIIGQWDNSNNWGIGPNSNSSSDNALRIGTTSANGVNTWSTTQNVNLVVAGTEKVQPTTNNNSASTLVVENTDGESVFQTGTIQAVDNITNYIADPEFAAGSGNCPLTDWTVVGSPTTCTQNTTTADSYEADTSLELVTTTSANQGISTSAFTSTVSPGASSYYTVSFYAMQTTGTPLTGSNLEAVTAGDVATSTCTIAGQATGTLNSIGFEQVVCTLSYGSSGTITSLAIETTGSNLTADTFYISDVQLQIASGSGGTISALQIGQINLRGVVTSPVALQNNANSSTALQVQNAAGSDLINVNTNDVNVATSVSADTSLAKTTPTGTGVRSLLTSTNVGSGITTLAIAPHAVGDLVVVGVLVSSNSFSVTSITRSSGTATITWQSSATTIDNNTTQGFHIETWYGTVTAAGSYTLQVNWSSSIGSTNAEIVAQEFSAGLGSGTSWSVITSGNTGTSGNSTTINAPSLSSGAGGSGALYWSYTGVENTGQPGYSSGFNYAITPTDTNVIASDTNLAANTTYAPVAYQSSGTNFYSSDAVIFSASADNTLAVNGSTIIAGPNSATAFQVQNSAGASMLDVDTANNLISLEAGYSGSNGSWTQDSYFLPNNVSWYGAAVAANGYVYDLMGDNNGVWNGDVYYAKADADGQLVNPTYATATQDWGSTTANTTYTGGKGYQNMAAVATNGYVYEIGGDGGASNDANAVNTVEYASTNHDGTLGSWTTNATNLPATVTHAVAVAANGYIYIIGGDVGGTAGGSKNIYYGKVNADGSISSWTTVASALTTARQDAMAMFANGYIVVIGGGTGSTSVLSSVEAASVNASTGAPGTFSTTGQSSLNTGVAYAGAVIQNGYIYVIGGGTNDTLGTYAPISTVQYAPIGSNGTVGGWTNASSASGLPETVEAQSTVALNGYMYVIGGVISSGGTGSWTAYFSSAARVTVNASLDLLGPSNSSLADGADQSDGSSGGSLTAGDTTIAGSLSVAGQATLNNGLVINGNLVLNSPFELYKETSDPTGIAGEMYYNSSTNVFRCYENGTWENCITDGDTLTTMGFAMDDFTNASTSAGNGSPWTCAALTAGGTLTAGAVTGRSVDVVNSTATSATGYQCSTGQTQVIGGGDTFEALIDPATLTNVTTRVGFMASSPFTTGSTTNGCWISVLSTPAITDTCSKAGTVSSGGLNYAPTAGTWYRLKIVINTTTSVSAYVYSTTGSLLASDTFTPANGEPTAAVATGFISYNTSTNAVAVADYDEISMWYSGLAFR